MAEDLAQTRAPQTDRQAEIAISDLLALTGALEAQENDRLDEIEALKARARAAEAEVATLKKDAAALRAHRDALLASTSWKITGPVRVLSRLLRGK